MWSLPLTGNGGAYVQVHVAVKVDDHVNGYVHGPKWSRIPGAPY